MPSPTYDKGLITVATELFEVAFDLAYQADTRKLAGAVTEQRGIVGSAYHSKEADQWILGDRGAYHSEIEQTIPKYREITVTPLDKIALVPSDKFEQLRVNASERQIQAENASNAIKRMEDQIDINAMNAEKASMDVVNATSNLTVAKILEMARILDFKNVPDNDRVFVGTPSQKESLLNQEKATSQDYATVKALVNGDINTFAGFRFIWIGNMAEGGLTKVATIRDCYAFQKRAIRALYWMNPSVSIDWLATKQSWAIIPALSKGTKVYNTDGFVHAKCTESA